MKLRWQTRDGKKVLQQHEAGFETTTFTGTKVQTEGKWIDVPDEEPKEQEPEYLVVDSGAIAIMGLADGPQTKVETKGPRLIDERLVENLLRAVSIQIDFLKAYASLTDTVGAKSLEAAVSAYRKHVPKEGT